MGFYPEPTLYHLTFPEGDPLHGLEVTMGSLSVGEYNAMMRRALARGLSEETLKANDEMIDLFVSKIASWTLEDKAGAAVPVTREAVDGLDRRLIAKLITAWQSALIGVPDDLGKGSQNGELSPEESLGLGSLSASQPS
jgi:hypothetical protein